MCVPDASAVGQFPVKINRHSCARPQILAGLAPALISKSRRVLLVEDQPDAREAMSALLEMEGHAVSASSDGDSGLLMAVDSAYDVLICDIGLPGMDGIELMQRLRAEGRQKQPFAIAFRTWGCNYSDSCDGCRFRSLSGKTG